MSKKFYNLIILDKSGSMCSIAGAAVAGVNETLGIIRKAKKETGCDQEVSILPFCGCSTDYMLRNVPVDRITPVTSEQYQPCCSTPLLDAIGKGCTELKKHIGAEKDIAVSVTIITDGYENSSKEWTYPAVKALIEGLKAEGWLFAFIGANIDVNAVSQKMAIDNTLSFEADEDGTRAMFERESLSRARWSRAMAQAPSCASAADINRDYFRDEDDDK